MIIIPIEIKNILFKHSNNENGEVCFILLGNIIDESIDIQKAVKITNDSISLTTFKFKQCEVDRTCQYAIENNYDVICIFHSHPTSTAAPSKRDIESMKLSDKIWFIYSKLNNNMFAFTYKDKLESIEIFTIDTQKL